MSLRELNLLHAITGVIIMVKIVLGNMSAK